MIRHSGARLFAGLLLAVAAWQVPAAGTPGSSPMSAKGALHGTLQGMINAHGELVLVLDRRAGPGSPPDGRADRVVLARPLEPGTLDAVAYAFREPVRGVTLERRENSIRVVVPGESSYRLATTLQDGAHRVIGIAQYWPGPRDSELPDALRAFEGVSVLAGRGTSPNWMSPG